MDPLSVYRYSNASRTYSAHAAGRFQRVAGSEPVVLRCHKDLRSDHLPGVGSSKLRPIPEQHDPNGSCRTSQPERSGNLERLSWTHSRLSLRHAELDRTGSTPD